jgi:hypothetical protein
VIIQLNALRYQDGGIVLAQQVALFADLGLLVWFFHRQWRMRQDGAAISRWRPGARRLFHPVLGRADRRVQPRLHGRARTRGENRWQQSCQR